MNAELTKMKKWMVTGLCATVVLCCTAIQTVFAQDYEAVGKRLRQAVAAGELTGEQARAMLGTLREVSHVDQDRDKPKVDMGRAVKRVRVAIEAGDITPEQGRARLQAMRKRMAGGTSETRGRDPRAAYAAAEKEITAAIDAGRITEAQGKERLAGLRRRLAAGDRGQRARGENTRGERTRERDSKAVYQAAEKEIKAAIAEGKITAKQGRERLAGLRRHLAGDARGTREQGARDRRVDARDPEAVYKAAEKEVKLAIKFDRITEEQGRERLAGLRRRLAAGVREVGEHDSEHGEEGEHETRRDRTRRR